MSNEQQYRMTSVPTMSPFKPVATFKAVIVVVYVCVRACVCDVFIIWVFGRDKWKETSFVDVCFVYDMTALLHVNITRL
jgi:hypothetical protein